MAAGCAGPTIVVPNHCITSCYADRADGGMVGTALAPYWADMHSRIAIAQEVRRVGDLIETIINMAVNGVLDDVLGSVPSQEDGNHA